MGRDTRLSFVRPSRPLRMRLAPRLRLLSRLESLSVRLLLSLERLRRARLFLMVPTAPSDSSRMTLLTPEVLLTTCRPSMAVTWDPSASLNPASTPFRLRLMVCWLLPRTPKRRPRRLWLMLLVLLMNSVLSRNMFPALELERTLFPMLLENLRDVFLMLRMLPSSLARLPRLSLPPPSPALVRPPRLTRELSARLRSFPLPRVR